MRSLDNYRRLIKDRKSNVLDISNRYQKGMDQVKKTVNAITNYYKELESKIPVLNERQAKLVAIIVDI